MQDWCRITSPYLTPERKEYRYGSDKSLLHREGNTLTVWFGNPASEYIAEETGQEIVLMKDQDGKVIGFEKLNFTASQSTD